MISQHRWGRRFSVIALVAVLIAGGSMVYAQDSGGDATQPPILSTVTAVADSVYMLEDGADAEKRIVLTTFEPGETLRTDASGAALITWFYDGTETLLAQDSRLTLNDFAGASDQAFTIDMTLEQGHLVAGLGGVAANTKGGSLTVSAADIEARLISGQMEVTVLADGSSLVTVPFGSAEVSAGDGDPVTLVANEAFSGGEKVTISEDGITPALEGLCVTTANTNLVVRMYPSENSQRLGGVPSGQSLWVRAGTEGNLWLQIAYATDPLQTDLFNYGWVYGPATTLGEGCGTIPLAALDAQIYGGGGINEPAAEEGASAGTGS